MHLVGFITEIYYDARPYESQICWIRTVYCWRHSLTDFNLDLYYNTRWTGTDDTSVMTGINNGVQLHGA